MAILWAPQCLLLWPIYIEEVESRTLSSFKEIRPSHWYGYMDVTWVKIKTKEVEAFTKHLNSVDNIKFTRENMKENRLLFLDCAMHLEKDGRLNEVYWKTTHTDQYLLFNSLWNTSWELLEPDITGLKMSPQREMERLRNINA